MDDLSSCGAGANWLKTERDSHQCAEEASPCPEPQVLVASGSPRHITSGTDTDCGKQRDTDLDSSAGSLSTTAEPSSEKDTEGRTRTTSALSTPQHGLEITSDDLPLIVFDWDDTLLPTTFLRESADMCEDGCDVSDVLHLRLAKHARQVETLLRQASQFGRVAILTLAARPWVSTSAESFLPGVDFPSLCEELGLSVSYARDHQEGVENGEPIEDITAEECIWLKQQAFTECINEAYGRTPDRLSLVSIGDSAVEQKAAQDVARLWANQLPSDACVEPLCKTVKLMDNPSLEELSDELRELIDCFPKLTEWTRDVHLDVESPEEIGRQADKCLRPPSSVLIGLRWLD